MCQHWFGQKYYEIRWFGFNGNGHRRRQVRNWYKTCQNCGYDRFLYGEYI